MPSSSFSLVKHKRRQQHSHTEPCRSGEARRSERPHTWVGFGDARPFGRGADKTTRSVCPHGCTALRANAYRPTRRGNDSPPASSGWLTWISPTRCRPMPSTPPSVVVRPLAWVPRLRQARIRRHGPGCAGCWVRSKKVPPSALQSHRTPARTSCSHLAVSPRTRRRPRRSERVTVATHHRGPLPSAQPCQRARSGLRDDPGRSSHAGCRSRGRLGWPG
jgi:hypothetical protein